MLAMVPIPITDDMVTSSTVAEPDTTRGETAWSSSELVTTGAERIIAAPSANVTISNGSPAVITWTGNGLAVGTELMFATSGSLPAGITAGARYFVLARISVDTFTLVDTDGRTVNTTSAGSGTHTATAKVHKVYRAAIGYSSKTITSVDTGTDRLTSVAHGFTDEAMPIMFSSTGTLPSPLVAGTVYYPDAITTDNFKVQTGGGAGIDITTTGSGTISVHYVNVAATTAPNYNKPPMIETSYWTEVSSTNKWAMFDSSTGSQTIEGTSPLKVTLIPGEEWDTAAIMGLEGVSGATLRYEINRTTVTFTAATNKVNWAAHGRAAGDPVCFTTTDTLPAEVTAETTYYVKNPGTDDFEIASTVGGATIDISGAGSGTHTAGYVVHSSSLDTGRLVPYATVVSEANRETAAYQNGTLTVTMTGSGTVRCAELKIGIATNIGDAVNNMATGIRNYTVFTRDEFGNVTKTIRGYSKWMRGEVFVKNDNALGIDEVSQFLAVHKDDDMLLIASDNLETHTIYGPITEWEMSAPSERYKTLTFKAEGLTAT